MKNNKTRWILIAAIAAVVAAATTVLVLVLRARANKKAWYEQEAIDYDVDDCDCIEFDDEECFEEETNESVVGE